MNGIGGGASYLFCFEELRCELLEQCSSKRFVIEGWLISISKRVGRKSGVLGRGRERERGVVQVRGRPHHSR